LLILLLQELHSDIVLNTETFIENGFTANKGGRTIQTSNMYRPVAIRNIESKNVSFVVGQAKSGRNPPINIKYEGQNLLIGLPRMSFPGGVLIRDGENGMTSYTLIGTLKGCDPFAKERGNDAEDVGKFYNFLLDTEESIIKAAVENSVKWFGKRRSEEAVRDSFKRILSISSDKVDGEYVPNGKYPPSFRVKLPVYDGRLSCAVEDNLKNPVYTTPDTLASVFPKGIEVGLVVSGSIYVIAGGGFGVTWRMQAAQVWPQARARVTDFFRSEAAPEEEETEGAPAEETQVAEETQRPSTPQDQGTTVPAQNAPARKRRVAPAS
jgi:hypothetical protein